MTDFKTNTQKNKNIYLFSIDLEDVRTNVVNGNLYKDRVPENTRRYLEWLRKSDSKCTFFTTGKVAKSHPLLIREIVDEGHEIACHTTNHSPLDSLTKEEFKIDMEENISLLLKAGANEIKGFRAPFFSLTEKTQWAYPILKQLGICYSSSILPAKSPLYGWESFGPKPRILDSGIVEIPVTIGKLGLLSTPCSGGVYFRSLPFFIIKRMIQKRNFAMPLVGYFHPYDIDTEQEKFMHAGINNNHLFNWLMYYNRKNVFNRLDSIIGNTLEICTYNHFINHKLTI